MYLLVVSEKAEGGMRFVWGGLSFLPTYSLSTLDWRDESEGREMVNLQTNLRILKAVSPHQN